MNPNDSAGDGPPPAAGPPALPDGPDEAEAPNAPDHIKPPALPPVGAAGSRPPDAEAGHARARDAPPANLYLTISPGRLGITVQFVEAGLSSPAPAGAVITRVDPHCSFGERVSAGDRLVSIDGRPVSDASDLAAGADGERLFGFALVSSAAGAAAAGAAVGGGNAVREGAAGSHGAEADEAAETLTPPEVITVPPGPLGVEVSLTSPGRAVVVRVAGSSPVAGVVYVGDAILTLNGMPVERPDDLTIGTDRERKLGISRRAVSAAERTDEDAKEEDSKPPALPDAEAEGGDPDGQADAPTWEERYEELRLRVSRTGDCLVPQREEGGLGTWLKNQRYRASRGELSEERTAMLTGLGVTWTEPGEAGAGREATWEERCLELAAFYEEHGHFRVPREDERLRRWMDK